MPNRIWYLFSLKLSGEATQAELDEFHELLAAHPEWEASIQQITRYWLQSKPSEIYRAENTIPNWHEHLKRLQASGADWISTETPEKIEVHQLTEPRTTRQRKYYWWAAAALVLVGLTGWWLFSRQPAAELEPALLAQAKQNEVVTHPASRSQLILPDGSKVWLNASSKLTYSNGFGENNRNVWLEGEAYFNVFKNKQLPFIIHTSRMNIRVTGTVFNVRAYPRESSSETALIEGSVEVALAGDKEWKYHLKPQQKLVVNDQGISYDSAAVHDKVSRQPITSVPAYTASLQSLAKPLPDNQVVETAWVYNLLSFSDESFRQVANKMEKWYGTSIHFNDPELENWHFTGSFRSETLSEALTALQLTTSFSFTVRENDVLISKPHK